MKTSTKYEIRRSVRRKMMPSPHWEYYTTVPECSGTGCLLYVQGKCAYLKRDVVDGAPCIPCIRAGLERVK